MAPTSRTSPETPCPEIRADATLADAVRAACEANGGLESLEEAGRIGRFDDLDLLRQPGWLAFVEEIREIYRWNDHVVVRGLPVTEDGASLLVASLSMSWRFRTYRGNQIVKKFSMSPWTRDLSHTTREGDFHTDLNTAPEPPVLTAIQCLVSDPGAPEYGQNRVARLEDLLARLEEQNRGDVSRFLRQTPVTMTNGSGQDWSGTIVADGTGAPARIPPLRYHPATLRAASQSAEAAAALEKVIAAVHEAALAISVPFDLRSGDLLLVSNHRALHYRGECSVSFRRFPTEYDARQIFVLHQMGEPS